MGAGIARVVVVGAGGAGVTRATGGGGADVGFPMRSVATGGRGGVRDGGGGVARTVTGFGMVASADESGGRTTGRLEIVVVCSSASDGGRTPASASTSLWRPCSIPVATRSVFASSSAWIERLSGSGSRPRPTASSTDGGRSGRSAASEGNVGSAIARSTSRSDALPRTIALRPVSSSQSRRHPA